MRVAISVQKRGLHIIFAAVLSAYPMVIGVFSLWPTAGGHVPIGRGPLCWRRKATAWSHVWQWYLGVEAVARLWQWRRVKGCRGHVVSIILCCARWLPWTLPSMEEAILFLWKACGLFVEHLLGYRCWTNNKESHASVLPHGCLRLEKGMPFFFWIPLAFVKPRNEFLILTPQNRN